MTQSDILQEHDAPLYGLNTFGFRVSAQCLVELTDVSQLEEISADKALPRPFHILGGGSNVLLNGPVQGTVILNRIKGIEVTAEDSDHVWLKVGAGEVWHDLVLYAIANGLGGLENLALIPGTVGASPIQNIGAYGVEVKDTIAQVAAWDWEASGIRTFSNEACRFGYRDSIFKQELRGRVVVTSVTFRLSRHPLLNVEYGAIRDELASMNADPSVESIAQAVINIRRSKLPDPAVIGNAGSFFKNPTIPGPVYESLKTAYPALPAYPAPDGQLKVPAGWLIEACGWKGFRRGDAGVHARQALVLVNYGTAGGADIWALSEDVLQSVRDKFGIELEREVQVW